MRRTSTTSRDLKQICRHLCRGQLAVFPDVCAPHWTSLAGNGMTCPTSSTPSIPNGGSHFQSFRNNCRANDFPRCNIPAATAAHQTTLRRQSPLTSAFRRDFLPVRDRYQCPVILFKLRAAGTVPDDGFNFRCRWWRHVQIRPVKNSLLANSCSDKLRRNFHLVKSNHAGGSSALKAFEITDSAPTARGFARLGSHKQRR